MSVQLIFVDTRCMFFKCQPRYSIPLIWFDGSLLMLGLAQDRCVLFQTQFYVIMCDVATSTGTHSYERKKVVFRLACMLSHYFTYRLSLRTMYELKYYLVFQLHYSTNHQMLILWMLYSVRKYINVNSFFSHLYIYYIILNKSV